MKVFTFCDSITPIARPAIYCFSATAGCRLDFLEPNGLNRHDELESAHSFHSFFKYHIVIPFYNLETPKT